MKLSKDVPNMRQQCTNDDAIYQWCANRDIGDVTLACDDVPLACDDDDDNQFKAHNVKMISTNDVTMCQGCIDDGTICQRWASVPIVCKWSANDIESFQWWTHVQMKCQGCNNDDTTY